MFLLSTGTVSFCWHIIKLLWKIFQCQKDSALLIQGGLTEDEASILLREMTPSQSELRIAPFMVKSEDNSKKSAGSGAKPSAKATSSKSKGSNNQLKGAGVSKGGNAKARGSKASINSTPNKPKKQLDKPAANESQRANTHAESAAVSQVRIEHRDKQIYALYRLNTPPESGDPHPIFCVSTVHKGQAPQLTSLRVVVRALYQWVLAQPPEYKTVWLCPVRECLYAKIKRNNNYEFPKFNSEATNIAVTLPGNVALTEQQRVAVAALEESKVKVYRNG
jgi:hypothetical protein